MRLSATRLTSMAQAGGGRTPTQRAIAVLRKFGTDAHIYLPGVGMLNGLQAGNYIDSALTTPAAIDNPVGGVVDAMGGINATQPTTSAKPILRRGAVNLLTYSGDFGNAAWMKLDIAVSVGLFAGPDGSLSSRKITELATTNYHQFSQFGSPVAGTYTQAVICKPSGASHITLNPINQSTAYGDSTNRAVTFDLATGSMTQVFGTSVTHSSLAVGNGFYLFTATATTTNNSDSGPTVRLSNTATPNMGVSYTGNGTSGIFVQSTALFQGTYTAQQIQALGGIPTTLTAPVSTALGAYWWDTSGSKSLVATFPAGNESVTVINATPTGQVTTTAQNVVGAYSINTNTNGRIIVNGALTASELALLQSYANRLAGL